MTPFSWHTVMACVWEADGTVTCRESFVNDVPLYDDVHFYIMCTPNYAPLCQNYQATFPGTVFRAQNLHVKFYDIPPSLRAGGFRFESAAYGWAVVNKVTAFLEALEAHTDGTVVILSDADIQFFAGRERHWSDLMRSFDGCDILAMEEPVDPGTVNVGFMIVRRSARTVALFRETLRIVRSFGSVEELRKRYFYEQGIINELLAAHFGGVVWRTIPREYVVWGTWIPEDHRRVLFHHAVIAFDTDDKAAQMRDIKAKIHV